MPLREDHVRILKKPFGHLIKEEEVSKEKIIFFTKNTNVIITVGDATTERIISYGILPNLAIIDGVERRIRRSPAKISKIRSAYSQENSKTKEYNCRNPKGTISKDAYTIIEKTLQDTQKTIVLVDGEEDMLALPVFSLAPIGSVVFYGQPLEGLVMVNIDSKIRDKSKYLLDVIGIG